MAPGMLGLILLTAFAAAWLARRSLEPAVVRSAPAAAQARRQFILDLTLCFAVGVAVMLFNWLLFHFPIVGSGFKVIFGTVIAGFFVSLDMALNRERFVIVAALEKSTKLGVPLRLYPMTRRFSVVAVSTALFVASIIGLIMSGDIGWLSKVGETGLSVEQARNAVVFEVFFVMAVLLIWVVNLIVSYSRNLKMLFDNETSVLERVSRGDLSERVPVATSDEFGFIAGHTNTMIDGLRHRLELITSLQLAEDVQRALLPQKAPHIEGYDIAGVSIYCDKTGGDYYDYIDLPEGRLGIVVGDVSGHGIPSALLMTTVRAQLRQRTAMPGSLADVIADVNRQFADDVEDSGQFMTLFYCELDPQKSLIRWVRAGHDPALVFEPGSGRFHELMGEGMPLGVLEDVEFDERSAMFAPGQIIVIGTDGIWETRNRHDEMFGKERLRDVIRSHAGDSARAIVQAVLDSVNQFRHPLGQDDDITLVVLRALAGEGGASPK